MSDNRAQALTAYLHALAILQQTNKTYVHKEVTKVIEEIERELGIKR